MIGVSSQGERRDGGRGRAGSSTIAACDILSDM